MFGPPEKVDGKCNARLYIADDYGDNECTIQCELDAGHSGEHCETFERESTVKITWNHNEKHPY